jgi:hypothetical protein
MMYLTRGSKYSEPFGKILGTRRTVFAQVLRAFLMGFSKNWCFVVVFLW